MSVVHLPEGYAAGDMLVMPVFLTEPDARVSVPEGWLVARNIQGDPLELEHPVGFYTAFWRVAEEDEPQEITLEVSDPDTQVVAQIIPFGRLDSDVAWSLPPVGSFGNGTAVAGSIIPDPDTTVTFTSSDTWVVPDHVTTAVVECWGAGGPSSNATHTPNAQNGGGGGAYARSVVSVTPGASIPLVVPSAPAWTSNEAGSFRAAPTSFNGGEVEAEAGLTTNSAATGTGGAAANSTGDVVFSGGNGGLRQATNAAGGGGGGAAGPTGNGAAGNAGAAGVGGTGGAGNDPGGDGGNGGNTSGNPTAGTAPGGGAGGRGLNGSAVGISGGSGQIRITYPTAQSGWQATTVNQVALQAGDQLLVGNILQEDQDLSNDRLDTILEILPYGSGAYGSGSYGGTSFAGATITNPTELDEVYTGLVLFRTAVSDVLTGASKSTITHRADAEADDVGILLLMRLRDESATEHLNIHEGQTLDAWKHDSDDFQIQEGRNISLDDGEVFDITETAIPFIDEFSIVFNESRKTPGFNISLRGLLEFSYIQVFRRDVTGRYPDQDVRGLTRQVTIDNEMYVTDYEAPLNAVVHYYIRLEDNEGGSFLYGPVEPTPQPFIPTLNDAYGEGTAFIKPIDLPELGFPVMMEEMDQWSQPANILAEHHVLGRPNKVIITDVRGGNEGTFSGHCILHMGQSHEVVEAGLATGSTVLIQNHNPTTTGLKDMYVQIGNVSYSRFTKATRYGELENPAHPFVIFTFEAEYTEVDRPDPSGVELPTAIWNVVHNTFLNWAEVRSTRTTWLDVLARSSGPSPGWQEEESS